MDNATKGKALVDFEKIIEVVYSHGVNIGFKDGELSCRKKQKDESRPEETELEKACTEYVVEKFSDCKTLDDFTSVFKEIETRSFNFMH